MRDSDLFGDERNQGFCIHCGGPVESRDHVPSKAFLDEPLPDNLAVATSCNKCNNGFSADEHYMACLLDCIVAGTVDPALIQRPKIARALAKDEKLAATILACRREENGRFVWKADGERIQRVVVKHARCHIAYELNEPMIHEPDFISVMPLALMSQHEREAFERDDWDMDVSPEVGSRAFFRVWAAGPETFQESWLVVQDGRYRYRVTQGDGNRVRMVFREYLACEVAWDT